MNLTKKLLVGGMILTGLTLISSCSDENRKKISNHSTIVKEIQKGDTLWKYASNLKKENAQLKNMYTGYIVAYLAKFNKIEDSNKIKAGESISLPVYDNQ